MYLDVDVTFINKLMNLNLQDAFNLWTCLHLCVTGLYSYVDFWGSPDLAGFRSACFFQQGIYLWIYITFISNKTHLCVDQRCVCETYFCLWIYYKFWHADIHLRVHRNVFVRRESFTYKSQNTDCSDPILLWRIVLENLSGYPPKCKHRELKTIKVNN